MELNQALFQESLDRSRFTGFHEHPRSLNFITVFFFNISVDIRWTMKNLREENSSHKSSKRKEKGLEVFPIFYHVEPSDVRKQKGTFAEAFDKHKESFKESIEMVEKWRSTLTEVANLSGWDLQDRETIVEPPTKSHQYDLDLILDPNSVTSS
nr:isoform 2 of tmv resistance protein n [Quercus suber]